MSPKRSPACPAGLLAAASRISAPLALARPSDSASGSSRVSMLHAEPALLRIRWLAADLHRQLDEAALRLRRRRLAGRRYCRRRQRGRRDNRRLLRGRTWRGGCPPVGGRGGMRTMSMPESATLCSSDASAGWPAAAGRAPRPAPVARRGPQGQATIATAREIGAAGTPAHGPVPIAAHAARERSAGASCAQRASVLLSGRVSGPAAGGHDREGLGCSSPTCWLGFARLAPAPWTLAAPGCRRRSRACGSGVAAAAVWGLGALDRRLAPAGGLLAPSVGVAAGSGRQAPAGKPWAWMPPSVPWRLPRSLLAEPAERSPADLPRTRRARAAPLLALAARRAPARRGRGRRVWGAARRPALGRRWLDRGDRSGRGDGNRIDGRLGRRRRRPDRRCNRRVRNGCRRAQRRHREQERNGAEQRAQRPQPATRRPRASCRHCAATRGSAPADADAPRAQVHLLALRAAGPARVATSSVLPARHRCARPRRWCCPGRPAPFCVTAAISPSAISSGVDLAKVVDDVGDLVAGQRADPVAGQQRPSRRRAAPAARCAYR